MTTGVGVAAIVEAAAGCPRPVILAPYFALQQLVAANAVAELAPTALVATNYAVQGVKLKGVRALLHRVWCRLLHLAPEVLETAPFLARRDGIWLVDLALIPEKYRLDSGRAEAIYNRCLTRWLEIVEEGLGDG